MPSAAPSTGASESGKRRRCSDVLPGFLHFLWIFPGSDFNELSSLKSDPGKIHKKCRNPGRTSEHLLRFPDSLAPVEGAALGMGDGENDHLVLPNHVGDVMLAKTRSQVHPAHGSA